MANLTTDLAELVRVMVEPLVDNKEQLEVTQSVDETGDVYIEISVDPEDTGKVIGRQGRVIKSLRTLARAAGSRAGARHVDVELPE